jgi:hypothetical protein
MLKPENIAESTIESWAKDNLDRARALGLRLIQNPSAEALEALDSLGDDEDLIEAWAIAHPMRAKFLVMRLLPLFSAG